ncbi:MAG: (2Fe-2S)-binding protein, partial [Chloroflexi bacterium]
MQLTVNGATHEVAGDPARPIVTILRDDLALRGTKPACGEGVCGACTVLVDGDPVRSCVTAVGSVEGRSIMTIEGLTPTGSLSAVQQAFLAERAFQCGYCTPGLVVATSALLEHEGDPSTAAAIEALEGHVCRCGVQSRILRAVARAAAQ